jgi:hypothetical protein
MGKMRRNVRPKLVHIWETSISDDWGSSSMSKGAGGPSGLPGGWGPLPGGPVDPGASVLLISAVNNF